MIYNELNHAQNQLLAVLRTELQRGCVPDGYPAVMPMWRVESGVEVDGERDEAKALRTVWARLQEQDRHAHALLTTLASGRRVGSADWPTASVALDALDAAVEEVLSHG